MLKVANSVINVSQITGVLPVVNGGTGVTTSTGTGNTVLSATPTLSGDVNLSTGNLVIGTSGKGIDFSITSSSSGTMTSELLADYEEGTWTPVVSDATTAGNLATLSDAEGVYTKIGNVVYWRFNVVLTSKASMIAANEVFIQGFPFQSAAIPNGWYNPCPTIIRNITFTDFVQFNQVSNTTRGTFRDNVSNANGSDISVSDLTNSAGMQASGFYRVV